MSNGYLVFLGVGATLSVALHATVQCFGAARVGLPIWPGWGRHDAALRAFCRRVVPAIGTATLDTSWLFVLIVAAGTVPGGVVALQIGINFYNLPVALSAKAVGAVLLPRLSREALQQRFTDFRQTYDRGISWAWFVAVPASLTLLVSAGPIAQAIAFGRMRHGDGVALLTAAIAGLSLALIGATTYEFAKQACYARHNVFTPLVGCAVMVAYALVGAPIMAATFNGPIVLSRTGPGRDGRRADSLSGMRPRRTPRHACDAAHARDTLVRHTVAAAFTIIPGALLGRVLQSAVGGHGGAIVGVVVGVGVGLLAYVAVQARLGAPELPPNPFRGLRRRTAGREVGST